VEFRDLVRARSSVREYDPSRPVPRQVLGRILAAGRLAPSAAHLPPGQFLVISSPEALAGVRRCYRESWMHDAPHVIVVTGSAEAAWTREVDGWNSLETDLAIAMDHLVLAAAAEGVGTCWISDFLPDVLRAAVGLAADQRVFAITPLGYPRHAAGAGTPKKRKPLDEVVEYR